MAADRVKIQDIVANQLPTYVREDFPLLGEFLQQYYVSQEIDGGAYDLIQNLDQYVKVDELFNLTSSTVLASNVSYTDRSIRADVSGNFTYGFPETNGLIKIDDEIILYDYKTDTSFEGCTRGFSGVVDYVGSNTPDQLVFESTEADKHTAGATITNLSILFLQEFFRKIKYQFAPGFSQRTLFSGLDQRNFVFGLDSFYNSKGTDESIKILFRALYGVEADIIHPSEFLLRPSNADYKVTQDYVVETIEGDPLQLKNLTIFQKSTGARGSVTNVIPIDYDEGQYYQISIDTGYQRDIDVTGTIFGEFKVNPKTKLLNTVGAGTTILDVDSTIGFPESGDLVSHDLDGNLIYLQYESKTTTQFLNVTGVNYQINDKEDIRFDDYSYAYVGLTTTDEVRVRIASTLKNFEFDNNTSGYEKGDIVRIQSVGYESPYEVSKNWFYNVKTKWDVRVIETIDATENTYLITTYDDQFLKPGYNISLISTVTGGGVPAVVLRSTSAKSFIVKLTANINTSIEYRVENQILKGRSRDYTQLNDFFSNVQNTYAKFNGDALIASNSIARYYNLETNPYGKIKFFGGSFSNTYEILITNHGFYTGQAVYYQPGITKVTETTPDGIKIVTEVESKFSGVDAGPYYVKRVDVNTVSLARSRADLFADDLILLNGDVSDNSLEIYSFYGKELKPQGIYREIKTPESDSKTYTTAHGHTGILVNGVEILNYKSKDSVRYGEIQSMVPASGGTGYDVINPPYLHITDEIGVGATGTCSVTGSLERIEIVDPGFDYQKSPVINITGGNGSGAAAFANMISIQHNVPFVADTYNSQGENSLNLTDNTIGFSSFHKFRDNEAVIYITDNQTGVTGLSTGSRYYVGVVDASTVKLYLSPSDSRLGINTVSLVGNGNGTHVLRSSKTKSIISDIVVSNSGSGYENKKRNIPTNTGVSTALNQFNIPNHDYKSKEIVRYTAIGDGIVGLSTNKEYYVVKIDDDKFSLSEVGVGSTAVDYYYRNNILTNVETEGLGSFNYRPITVTVEGVTGVSTRTGQDFNAVVQPIFRGEITSYDISNKGVGYGSSEIVNFERQPTVTFKTGTAANLTPVISNGKIVEVVVGNGGEEFNSPPNLTITSTSGSGAVLTPIIDGGKIVEVKVVKGGAGYDQQNTSISVTGAGQFAQAYANIRNWTLNLFFEDFDNITPDDGFIAENINGSSLQYSHMYAPRPLRESIYGVVGNAPDNSSYGVEDLTIINGSEVDSEIHSPIIGWAYDGNPIYGPYGFANADGTGSIRRMISGYELGSVTTADNSPPFTVWPNGFFVEDYLFNDGGDLDEHNGRFCVTPDFPKGVYAYFATINNSVDSAGPFEGYRRPTFPYLIGNTYYSVPNSFNFKSISNQIDYDIESNNWIRETSSYKTKGERSGYDYIFNSSDIVRQFGEIAATASGTISGVGIVTAGQNYKVGDQVIFNNEGTGGRNVDIRVDRVKGDTIDTLSASSTNFYNVEFIRSSVQQNSFIGFVTAPHNLLNNDVVTISGISTTYDALVGSYPVGVRSDNFILTLGVGTVGATGIVTYFYVTGALDSPNIRPNDILKIQSEEVKVLNVDNRSGRIRVLREVNGTTGAAYTSSSVLYEDPRKFSVNVGTIKTTQQFFFNRSLYFDPNESVGLGTVTGTGIGVTLVFSDPGVGKTQAFVAPTEIYYPGHGLKLNDKLIYSTNGGDSIEVWNGISGTAYTSMSIFSNLYAVPFNTDYIGLGTNKIGLSSTGGYVGSGATTGLLYFTSVGTGNTHNFTTDLNGVISGKVSRNVVTVSTASSHTLQKGDFVNVNVNPTGITTVVVKYDDYNRRIVFDPQSFVAGNVDTTLNTIEITNNPFKRGDKVIHTSSTPVGGLVNEKMYYVIPFEEDKIRLVANKFELNALNPQFVNLTSTSFGTLSKINPAVEVSRNNILKFDLSDLSLSFTVNGVTFSAFDLNFYSDSDYVNLFYKTEIADEFEVVKNGKVGIDSDAYLQITITNEIPVVLFYRFDIANDTLISDVKKEISIDTDVKNNNQINIVKTPFDGPHYISGIGTTTFQYNISSAPLISEYNSLNANPSYETTSTNVTGPVSKFKFVSRGTSYKKLPGITSVRSATGTGAILNPLSDNIGRVLSININNIGFDYPSDSTLDVITNLPEILKVESLSSFESIGISSQGRNYLVAPDLVVLDGFTKKVVDGLDLNYELGDEQVTIIDNSTGIYNITPRIIPSNNSNGLGIASVSYNNTTKVVRAFIDRNFTTAEADQFNFPIGSKVLVENLSVGVGSTGVGYNSADYDYTFFEVVGFDKKLDSFKPYVEYNLSGLIKEGQIPGNLDLDNSFGRIINTQDLPIYTSVLKTNDYFVGEQVRNQNNVVGIVERWNPSSEQLIISTAKEYAIGDVIIGSSSKTQSVVEARTNYNSKISTGAGATVVDSWQTNSGFLNDNLQKLPNNEYYQNFSYSINSIIPYQTWSEPVGSLNHTAGFAKFSDLDIISEEEESSIIQTFDSEVERIHDIVGEASLNCEYDWDLVSEVTVDVNGQIVSKEIVFDNKTITNYDESQTNRVLSIDDFSATFNSSERTTPFSPPVISFDSANIFNKIFTLVEDKDLTDERQFSIVSFLQEGGNQFVDEYAIIETARELGSFDVIDTLSGCDLVFYPIEFAYDSYDISAVAFSIVNDSGAEDETTLGNIVLVSSATTAAPPSTTTTLVSISSTYRSAKLLVLVEDENNEATGTELNLIHDGTNVSIVEYGNLMTDPAPLFSGIGTFDASISGSNFNITFTPNVSVSSTVTTYTSVVAIGDSTRFTTGTNTLQTSQLKSSHKDIPANASPTPVVVASYDTPYDAGYFILSVDDITNSKYEMIEFVVLNSSTDEISLEFGNVRTAGIAGTVGVAQTFGTRVDVTFTPNPNAHVLVNSYGQLLQQFDNNGEAAIIDLETVEIISEKEEYIGTKLDLRTAFGLKHGGNEIFRRSFDGSNSGIADSTRNGVHLPDHYFVSGELVTYSYAGAGTTQAIQISSTNVPGIGITDKLPHDLYIVKIDDGFVKFATTAENALKASPDVLQLTSVGIGTSHSITATNQNAKALVAIDNMIQSPIGLTTITTLLNSNIVFGQTLETTGITDFYLDDVIRVDDEYMIVTGVGGDNPTDLKVLRGQLGTLSVSHGIGATITKYIGQYNIVGNTINFVQAPYGSTPLSTTTGNPNYRDWTGITTHSTFQGRTFMRNAPVNSSDETYSSNYVFDDISSKFTGIRSEFTLVNGGSNTVGYSTYNAIILTNGIFQQPNSTTVSNSYNLSEGSGITTITYQGSGVQNDYDPNNSNLPLSGKIVSVSSTEGFGYQPLVSAGGTAIVSGLGTISSISIGNTGSGYRSGIQTVVNVGVQTYSNGVPNIEFIGTAAISGGHIVSIAITNPGTGYTSTNPPEVVIDSPLGYSDIPLVYSGATGLGTGARVNINVGQGSSVIDFVLTRTGYGYKDADVLTVEIGGATGIPTDTTLTFTNFELTVESLDSDTFSGWTVGSLQVLDPLDTQFDGKTSQFSLSVAGIKTSIEKSLGSSLELEQNLIVFINNILQVPGSAYQFSGGSKITFAEAPQVGDTSAIIFYRGTENVDINPVEIIKNIKEGDTLQINHDQERGQTADLDQDPRTVTDIVTTNVVETNPYKGSGITQSETLLRPVTWCRQTTDKIIDGNPVGKDRENYEPLIYPAASILKSVGIGSTIVYVDNVAPLFDQFNEGDQTGLAEIVIYQEKITIRSQDSLVSAAATAIVSTAGTISSFDVTIAGLGYTVAPEVTVSNPIGLGTTSRATATATLSGSGVASITVTSPGSGYTTTNVPQVLIASPQITYEDSVVEDYFGDFGIIVGLGTTSSGSQSQFYFDTFIPQSSPIRDYSYVGLGSTSISGISTGDYLVALNTNLSVGGTFASQTTTGTHIGIATTALDCVYQVASFEDNDITVTVGSTVGYTTTSRRIFVNVDNAGSIGYTTAPYLGDFSWGKITIPTRVNPQSFNFYGDDGYAGIITSALVTRYNPLKAVGYTTV